jgi:hypothetical protein
MAAIRRRVPAVHFEIFTEVPEWFFSESLAGGFIYHSLRSDVGLVQRSPLAEDLEATVARLDEMVGDDAAEKRLAGELHELDCTFVIVDISPLGLRAAKEAALPSVLIENFTWDWIYNHYWGSPVELRQHGERLAPVFASAELRIQTEPACRPLLTAFQVPPVARSSRLVRKDVRYRLGVPVDEPMIVVSMGGVRWDYGAFAAFEHVEGPWIVIPGGSDERALRRGRLLLLPFHADVYHPDLVAASDLVVSKLGYSTVAEAYRAGAAFAYVARPRFPETPVLARWVGEHMVAAEIAEEQLRNGAWLKVAEDLLQVPRSQPAEPNGADGAAAIILDRYGPLLI